MEAINEAKVRALALRLSKELRNGRFKRVSRQFLLAVDHHVLDYLADKVQSHPSKGKTLMRWY